MTKRDYSTDSDTSSESSSNSSTDSHSTSTSGTENVNSNTHTSCCSTNSNEHEDKHKHDHLCKKHCPVEKKVKHRFVIKLGTCKVKKTVLYNHIITTNITHHVKETINCLHNVDKNVYDKDEVKTVSGECCPHKPHRHDHITYDNCKKDDELKYKSSTSKDKRKIYKFSSNDHDIIN